MVNTLGAVQGARNTGKYVYVTFDFRPLAQGKKKHRDYNDHKYDSSLITAHTCLPSRGSSRPFLMLIFYDRLYVGDCDVGF